MADKIKVNRLGKRDEVRPPKQGKAKRCLKLTYTVYVSSVVEPSGNTTLEFESDYEIQSLDNSDARTYLVYALEWLNRMAPKALATEKALETERNQRAMAKENEHGSK